MKGKRKEKEGTGVTPHSAFQPLGHRSGDLVGSGELNRVENPQGLRQSCGPRMDLRHRPAACHRVSRFWVPGGRSAGSSPGGLALLRCPPPISGGYRRVHTKPNNPAVSLRKFGVQPSKGRGAISPAVSFSFRSSLYLDEPQSTLTGCDCRATSDDLPSFTTTNSSCVPHVLIR